VAPLIDLLIVAGDSIIKNIVYVKKGSMASLIMRFHRMILHIQDGEMFKIPTCHVLDIGLNPTSCSIIIKKSIDIP